MQTTTRFVKETLSYKEDKSMCECFLQNCITTVMYTQLKLMKTRLLNNWIMRYVVFSKLRKERLWLAFRRVRCWRALANLIFKSCLYSTEIVERWSNNLDSMLIRNFPYWADLVWNDAVGNNSLWMHSAVAT